MAAYVISEVVIVDAESAARYRELAATSIEQYGGRYLARGAQPDIVEGGPDTGRLIVIVEFPSMERARQWYSSLEYGAALNFRDAALRRRLMFVEGLAP